MDRLRRLALFAIAMLAIPASAAAQWETPNRAFHKTTAFPLEGRHLTVACESCHVKGELRGTPTTCYDCHWSRRQDDPFRTRLGTKCEQCHQPTSWKAVNWNHAADAGTPLNAGHLTLTCDSCHKGASFTAPPATCTSCHQRDYDAAKRPDHRAAGFPSSCETCHRPGDATFSQARFNHNSSFALVGTHATVMCAACHAAGVYKGTPRDCIGCHRAGYDRTTSPAHAAAGFSTACETCHTASAPSFAGAPFNHTPYFALVGTHATQSCTACHGTGVYKGTSRDCVGCHRTEYDRTANPAHGPAGFSTTCDSCHSATAAGFGGATFNHSPYYPLVGTHATQTCTACHVNNVYAGTPTDCVGCHKTNYDRTTSPAHAAAGLPTTCEMCHTAASPSFGGGSFNHTPYFALVGTHATQSCMACHTTGVYKGTARDCIGCHKTSYDRTTSPAHAPAGFSTACETCRSASLPNFNSATFNHTPYFALVGTHATQACSACHVNNVYHGTARDCFGCHKTNYDRTTSPAHAPAGFSTACETCHSASLPNFNSATFNHTPYFALVGTHATQACSSCHVNNVYHGTARDCFGCHKTNYDRTTSPAHVAAGFPTTCETCHSASLPTFSGGTFNHTPYFPLVGTHATQTCTACHATGVYHGTARDCFGCHKTNYDRTTSPAHAPAGFSTACETCHSASLPNFNSATFNHTPYFALVGTHATQACSSCHVNNVYHGTARDCFGCHKTNYDRTTSPAHVAAGFPTTCETCHSASLPTFSGGTFNHTPYFPLVGTHATQACSACHVNNVYHGTARDCFGCHKTNYDRTTSPAHAPAGFSTACETCHSASLPNFNSATFNHTPYFALVGTHATQACSSCHVNNVYHGTARDCFGCHKTNYDRTTSPSHLAAGFPTACETCHSASLPTFNGGTFNHTPYFPLVGTHATQTCTACHATGVYHGTARDCLGCHRTNYDRTTSPGHAAAGLPTTCESCHKATDPSFTGFFNHAPFFTLVGVHVTQACSACHVNNVYIGTARDCVGCHRPVYDRSTNPNHAAAGFATTCDSCHKATDPSFNNGTYNHTPVYPLVGLHAVQTCTACHVNSLYHGTSRDCYSCHRTQYDHTSPSHATAGYPTSCDTCHKATDTLWTAGNFAHSFPIKTGAHKNNPCIACHLSPPNYLVFTCTTCHGRTQTDGNHHGVSGYLYDSLRCYACHPNGRAG